MPSVMVLVIKNVDNMRFMSSLFWIDDIYVPNVCFLFA